MSKAADQLTIRAARLDDLDDLEAVQRRASLALPEYCEQLEAHPEAIELPAEQITAGSVRVAELDGSIAGFAAVVAGELDGLFVEPELWGRNIGRRLIDDAVHLSRQQGLSLTVVASPQARGFYEKCGFVYERDEQTRFGRALRMSR